jgi:RHS repeat-associated protein
VDYLGGQYWSEVFQWQNEEVVIDEGMVDLRVTWNGEEVSGAPVYLFTETGSYLNRNVSTDAQGHGQFTVPVKPYKFRIDYNGHQYWTPVITPIEHQPLSVEVPLEQLALMDTNDPKPSRYDGEAPVYAGEQIKIASLGSLIGLLTQTTVAQVTQPKVYYYLTDHLGTPQKVIDSAGVVVWSGDYKPFGEVVITVSTVQNHIRFPGQYYEHETAQHYNYHRFYVKRLGRYATPDPTGLEGGINVYSYAANNPIIGFDPIAHAVYYCTRNLEIDREGNFRAFDPRAFHGFIFIDSGNKKITYGLTSKDLSSSTGCGVEGPGYIDKNKPLDKAATRGVFSGRCLRISQCDCEEEKKLVDTIERIREVHAEPYYCLDPDGSRGINCQDWARMMLRNVCGASTL